MIVFAAVYLALSSLAYLCLIAWHHGSREGVRAVASHGEASASRVPSGPPESTNAEHDNRAASGQSGSAAPHKRNATDSR